MCRGSSGARGSAALQNRGLQHGIRSLSRPCFSRFFPALCLFHDGFFLLVWRVLTKSVALSLYQCKEKGIKIPRSLDDLLYVMIDVFILQEQQWNAWWLQDFPSLRKELCGHMLILKMEKKILENGSFNFLLCDLYKWRKQMKQAKKQKSSYLFPCSRMKYRLEKSLKGKGTCGVARGQTHWDIFSNGSTYGYDASGGAFITW